MYRVHQKNVLNRTFPVIAIYARSGIIFVLKLIESFLIYLAEKSLLKVNYVTVCFLCSNIEKACAQERDADIDMLFNWLLM